MKEQIIKLLNQAGDLDDRNTLSNAYAYITKLEKQLVKSIETNNAKSLENIKLRKIIKACGLTETQINERIAK